MNSYSRMITEDIAELTSLARMKCKLEHAIDMKIPFLLP